MLEIESYFEITRIIHSLGLSYMVTGSVGAMIYGEPRVTSDIDLVVDLTVKDITRLVSAFPSSQYYCPPEEVIEVEVRRRTHAHFNIIDHATGFKADVYPVGEDALRRWALAHTRTIRVENLSIVIAPPEYIIIRKLEYFREGGSEKHLRDIRSMFEVSAAEIDQEMIAREVSARSLHVQWDRVTATFR